MSKKTKKKEEFCMDRTEVSKDLNSIINHINLRWCSFSPNEENIDKWGSELTEKVKGYILSKPDGIIDIIRECYPEDNMSSPKGIATITVYTTMGSLMHDDERKISYTMIFDKSMFGVKKRISKDERIKLSILCNVYWKLSGDIVNKKKLTKDDKTILEKNKPAIEMIISGDPFFKENIDLTSQIYRMKPEEYEKWLDEVCEVEE